MKQITELFRRGIAVPLTDSAEACMRGWFAEPTISVLHLRIADDEAFHGLWKTKVFKKLNQACGVIIDDYEEEVIEPGQLEQAIKVILEVVEDSKALPHRPFLQELIKLLERAMAEHRPVFFIL